MKRVLLLFTLGMIAQWTFAQLPPIPQTLERKQCLDTANIELTYLFKFKFFEKQKDFAEDVRKILIGNHVVKEFSHIVFHYDSLATENFRKGLNTQNNTNQTYPCEIFSNIDQQTREEMYRMILNTGVLCYSSQWIIPQYSFVPDDTLRISGHLCNKAHVSYAGRNYIAWYTLDIPIPYGPFKFFGLPGLVIKIEEETGVFVWELMAMKHVHTPIYKYKYDGEQNSTEAMAKRTINRMMSSPMAFLQTAGSKVMFKRSDGSFGAPSQDAPSNVYHPIEIE